MLEEKFWNQVDKTGDCWIWTGRTERGYGRVGRRGLAHRVAYEFSKGPIPEGLEIRHTCDTPPCVKPDHLVAGTHAENMRDMVERERGGGARGEWQMKKTHCPQNHPYDDENTVWVNGKHGKGQHRRCRICRNESSKEAKRRARAR